jgi:DNA topoisomerase-1
MESAVYRLTKVEIQADGFVFLAEGKQNVFEGFQKVSGQEEDKPLPALREKQNILLKELTITEHTTKAPARFTDASLVKLLEEKGIGRPSTYAPTIYTLIKRGYVRREKGTFMPSDLGIEVCDLLIASFPTIMDEQFTAEMENKLDAVEEGKIEWKSILKDFYPSFKQRVDKASTRLKKTVEYTEEKCPTCNRPLVIKWSRKGRFLSCSGYPQCKYAKSISTDVPCPTCQEGKLIERRNRRGQRFYGCTRYPQCTYTTTTIEEKKSPSKINTQADNNQA